MYSVQDRTKWAGYIEATVVFQGKDDVDFAVFARGRNIILFKGEFQTGHLFRRLYDQVPEGIGIPLKTQWGTPQPENSVGL